MHIPGTQEHTKGAGNIILIHLPKPLQRGTKNVHSGTARREGLGPAAQETIQGFTRYLTEDGKGTLTIESYVGDVFGFLTYLRIMGVDFDGQMRRFHVTSFRNHLVERDYEVSTVNKKVNSLQAFNLYLLGQGKMTEMVVDPRRDRVKVASGSERQVEVYDEKQLERLLFYVQGEKVSARDRAIILTLLYTGVRVSELCDIKVRNIDLLTGTLRVTGKGGKVREVPLKQEVSEAIRDYLPERAKNPYGSLELLFLGQRGPLQRDAVNTLLESHTVMAGLEVRLKPHTFRHTFCTRLINRGVPLTTVSKLAGHSNIDTTARYYINSSKEDKMRAVNML